MNFNEVVFRKIFALISDIYNYDINYIFFPLCINV